MVHAQETKSHMHPNTYDVLVQILLTKRVFVRIQDDNGELVLLPYVLNYYDTYVI